MQEKLENDFCLSRKYFGFDVANIASKFKNLVSILHAGKMYCAKTSSFRFSRRSKWKTVHAFAFLLIHARAIGRSENPGVGWSSTVVGIICSSWIGLRDLLESGGAMPPLPPAPTVLIFHGQASGLDGFSLGESDLLIERRRRPLAYVVVVQ